MSMQVTESKYVLRLIHLYKRFCDWLITGVSPGECYLSTTSRERKTIHNMFSSSAFAVLFNLFMLERIFASRKNKNKKMKNIKRNKE